VKILAQRNLVLPALGNPNRTVPREADNPTKNVADAILQHDNLVGLIKQVDLIDRWEGTRPLIMRLKDRASRRLGSPQTEEDRLRSIEGVLEKRLVVTNDDTTITITSEWSDPRMAYDIASAVEKNFIDARYDAEISVINDAIDILQQHANEEHDRFDEARNDFESVEVKTPKAQKPSTPGATTPHTATRPAVPSGSGVDPQLLRSLEETRAGIQQLEAGRSGRIAELNRQLSDALVTYRPEHPTVVAIKQKLAEAQQEPADLARLRNEERTLIDKVAVNTPPLAAAIARATTATPAAATLAALTSSSSSLIVEEDPVVTVARMKLQQSAQKYADLETRIDGAKIELDIAKTAHKYRFNIVRPAEVSRRPSKPNPVGLTLALLLFALAASFGSAVVRERRRGLLLERWQVEHTLGLPILGEIRT
jgi:capsular polysaccharide biosynthesis protein